MAKKYTYDETGWMREAPVKPPKKKRKVPPRPRKKK